MSSRGPHHASIASNLFKCEKLTADDICKFRKSLFETSDKLQQDTLILMNVDLMMPKRHRKENRKQDRQFACSYLFPGTERKKIRVCQQAFLQAIHPIKKNRLNGVIKRGFQSAMVPREGRGGDRWSHKSKNKKE